MYAMSPDGHALIGAHPRADSVFLAAGFSGHGFKFAPVVGEALAEQVLTGATQQRMGFLNSGRHALTANRSADEVEAGPESPT